MKRTCAVSLLAQGHGGHLGGCLCCHRRRQGDSLGGRQFFKTTKETTIHTHTLSSWPHIHVSVLREEPGENSNSERSQVRNQTHTLRLRGSSCDQPLIFNRGLWEVLCVWRHLVALPLLLGLQWMKLEASNYWGTKPLRDRLVIEINARKFMFGDTMLFCFLT